ncbi:hypothetical protein V8C35DRAFT_314562 [Trichoderma chlorosporum]
MMTNILWLRHLFDRFHSRISTFRENHHPEERADCTKTYSRHHEDMPVLPEEKSSLRPPRPSEAGSGRQSSTLDSEQRKPQSDASKDTDVPSEHDMKAEEMEHQRYGEAQPQLVPTDMIETMISAQGRKNDGINGA